MHKYLHTFSPRRGVESEAAKAYRLLFREFFDPREYGSLHGISHPARPSGMGFHIQSDVTIGSWSAAKNLHLPNGYGPTELEVKYDTRVQGQVEIEATKITTEQIRRVLDR